MAGSVRDLPADRGLAVTSEGSAGWHSGQSMAEAVEGLPVDAALKARLLQAAVANGVGSAPGMVDEVVAKARAARAAEDDQWP